MADVTAEMQTLKMRIIVCLLMPTDSKTNSHRMFLKEITLTCNPYYRWGDDKQRNSSKVFLQDTMKDHLLLSSMFGRYSLDKPGPFCQSGETLEDYLKQVPQTSCLTGQCHTAHEVDWFQMIWSNGSRDFKTTFGEENFEENLRFIEEALDIKTRETAAYRDISLTHLYRPSKTYKKRQSIDVQFSKVLSTLVYMHRYRPDTVSIILMTTWVFRTKLEAYLDNKLMNLFPHCDQAENPSLREIEKLKKQIAEIDEYERDVLYPLAGEKIEIDLDDGVKKNYPRFGKALRTIPGLDKGEE